MTFWSRLALGLIVATAVLMLLPGNTALGDLRGGMVLPASPAQTTTQATASLAAASPASLGPLQAADQRAQAALTADHVAADRQLLPTADPGVTVQNGQITPGSSLAPEPMGIADYGIQDEHGTNVGTISYTSSVYGVLTLNSIDLQYMDSIGPDEFTAQLNSVATDVTVHNDSGYQFWTQNVIYYYQSDSTLHLASAIVNFTSLAYNFQQGTIIAGNGYIAPGFGYFNPYGGTIYAPEPFTLGLWMNLSVYDNDPAVTFSYSVTSSAGTSAGAYDFVVFNSTVSSTPPPTYQINGQAVGDTGFIPNDVELILGGDGGGSTTSVLGIDGTMNLYTQPNGTSEYVPVPAAYDFGGETGETLEGVAEWASGGPDPTVHLGPGPSLQEPLWGVAGAAPFGERAYTLTVQPANAFVFVSAGWTFNPNVASWAYVNASGTATYELPPGVYSFQVLLSEYNPITLNHLWPGRHSITLSSNPALGIYTPIWVHTNAELAAVSQSGDGTLHDPYVLDNGPNVLLNPLFGQYNDYMFPVFPGILFYLTNAYVEITDEATFEVPFSLASEQYYSAVLPLDDELSWAFLDANHVSIIGNPQIGGWITYSVYGEASLILWNSTHDLVAANTFPDASLGFFIFGGTANTIWGNVFELSLPAAPDPAFIENYGNSVAGYLYESGDLVYNNYFGTPQTVFTPPYDPYDFYYLPELWNDRWSVGYQPATDVRVVMGHDLSGNILGLSYEGGNYWSNYGTQQDPYGVLPYNNGGNIVVHGDERPLEPFSLYKVTFTETGLPSGTQWNVTLNGIEETTTGTSLNFWDPSGLYAFEVTTPSSYTPTPSIGAVLVVSSAQTVSISWS